MKYIVTKNEDGVEEIFIFPKRYNHDDMAATVNHLKTWNHNRHNDWERHYKEPVAAGFTDGTSCQGRSETLNLESRGRIDEMLIE